MHYNTRQYFAASVGIRKTETVARRFFVKRYPWKFLKIHRETPGPESLF